MYLVRTSGRTLRMIVLTHSHPDHYVGAQLIVAAFPGVPLVTTQGVLNDFQASAPAVFAGLKQQFGSAIADSLANPTVLSGSEITLEGHRIRVFEQPVPGESNMALLLGLDEPRALLAGDLVYNNVHPVLPGCQVDGWKQDLDYVRSLGYPTIYPGHGAAATGTAVLDALEQYLDRAVVILNQAATVDEAKSMLSSEYSSYAGPGLLDFSVIEYFQRCRN
jgi:glyoxylase-like metal-dependent hydrolase (beta-lactamase superfamily II)